MMARAGAPVRAVWPRTRAWLGSAPCASGSCTWHEPRDSQEVVGRADHPGRHLGPLLTPVAGPSEVGDRLRPAEDLFDPLSNALAHAVPRVTGGAGVDRRSSTLADVLGDVGR